ncbi:MAG: hypothetical protein FWG65_02390 [Turicibacter sp.]|nr:hypothetical protein [Turicibacter sp.]
MLKKYFFALVFLLAACSYPAATAQEEFLTQLESTTPQERENPTNNLDLLQPFENNLVSGWNHILRIDELGELSIWQNTQPHEPIFTHIMSNVSMAAAHVNISAAIQRDGTLWIWGDADFMYRMFGVTDYAAPTKIAKNAVHVALADNSVLFVRSDGSLWGWADSSFSAFLPFFLENITLNTDFQPTLLISERVKYVSASYCHFMVIKEDDSLWGWGHNTEGCVGVGATPVGEDSFMYEQVLRPTFIMENVAYVLAESEGTSVITLGGELWAWGLDYLVTGTRMYSGIPVLIMEDVLITPTANNFGFTITSGGDLIAWGWGWQPAPSPTIDNPLLLAQNVLEVVGGGGFLAVRTEESLFELIRPTQ